MKIVFLILCHKNPEQINYLLKTLDDKDVDFYLHVDKKSNITDRIIKQNNIHFLTDDKRLDIRWGQSQMINATVNLIQAALKLNKEFDYFWFMSGQDFPIKSIEYIKHFLEANNGKNYIEIMSKGDNNYKRFLKRNELKYAPFLSNTNFFITVLKHIYILLTGGPNNTFFLKRKNTTKLDFNFGSSWWVLTGECIKYMVKEIKNNDEIMKYFYNSICPDESLFQSLFVQSPFLETKKEIFIYVDWNGQNKHPKTFIKEDYEELIKSKYLMARKFDENVDSKIINMLYLKLKK